MITHKEITYSGFWPMTKENTWFGYKVTDNFYQWYKTKQSAIKNIPNKKGEILRATLIGDKMYINRRYLNLTGW